LRDDFGWGEGEKEGGISEGVGKVGVSGSVFMGRECHHFIGLSTYSYINKLFLMVL